jgi:hypothetical protein
VNCRDDEGRGGLKRWGRDGAEAVADSVVPLFTLVLFVFLALGMSYLIAICVFESVGMVVEHRLAAV